MIPGASGTVHWDREYTDLWKGALGLGLHTLALHGTWWDMIPGQWYPTIPGASGKVHWDREYTDLWKGAL